jgi:hypothetical protein
MQRVHFRVFQHNRPRAVVAHCAPKQSLIGDCRHVKVPGRSDGGPRRCARAARLWTQQPIEFRLDHLVAFRRAACRRKTPGPPSRIVPDHAEQQEERRQDQGQDRFPTRKRTERRRLWRSGATNGVACPPMAPNSNERRPFARCRRKGQRDPGRRERWLRAG